MECFKTFLFSRFPLRKLLLRSAYHLEHTDAKPQASYLPKHVPPMIIASEKKKTSFSILLLNYGFSQGQVNHIFGSPAGILGLNEKDLTSNLANWCTFELNDKFYTAVTGHAELLTLRPSYVNSRYKELMTMFTKKDINKLLVTCPKVFLDDFDTIMEKVQYIVHNMQVEQKSIVKSHALQFDLDHIKCRHDFMCRSGIYRPVNKNIKTKNPPLSKIFCRNIETFLKLTHLTEEEYLIFCDVYEEDRHVLGSDEESDDEDEY